MARRLPLLALLLALPVAQAGVLFPAEPAPEGCHAAMDVPPRGALVEAGPVRGAAASGVSPVRALVTDGHLVVRVVAACVRAWTLDFEVAHAGQATGGHEERTMKEDCLDGEVEVLVPLDAGPSEVSLRLASVGCDDRPWQASAHVLVVRT